MMGQTIWSNVRSIARVWKRRLGADQPDPLPSPPPPVPLAEDHRLPIYLQSNGGRLALDGETLRLTLDDRDLAAIPLAEVSEVVLIGPVHVTAACLHALFRADIPISWHSSGGWFLGYARGFAAGGLARRLAQYRAVESGTPGLALARSLVAAKIHASRTLLRRNWKRALPPRLALCQMERLELDAERAESIDQLLGIEGSAAGIHFQHFRELLAAGQGAPFAAAFPGRRKRPPTDPLNAALSFTYAMLARAQAVALATAGFDLQLGFLHLPRAGRPSLALDLMEPLRPLIAESAVLSAINNGRLLPEHFIARDDAVLLDAEGRRKIIAAFEQRLSQEVDHPAFVRPLSYRAWLSAQARLLGDFLTGVRPDFPLIRPR